MNFQKRGELIYCNRYAILTTETQRTQSCPANFHREILDVLRASVVNTGCSNNIRLSPPTRQTETSTIEETLTSEKFLLRIHHVACVNGYW